jgi:iron complex transport system substrate-binding protein
MSESITQPDSIHFAHTSQVDYAEGFQISYKKNYKLLEVMQPFIDRVDTLRYALVPREIAATIQVDNAMEIPIPIKSLVTTSTTHLALTDMLEANDIISAVVGADYVYNENIRSRLNNEEVISMSEGKINKEQLIALKPDLVMISGGQSSQFDNYRLLRDSGINVMVNSEWLETTPLGKAEWVKVMAALLNKEELANKKFDQIAKKYNELKTLLEDVEDKPTVINNMPYKGAWFVAGGNSFTAQLLKDAGALYPWQDTKEKGGLRRDFEVVYEIGLEADIWINPGTAKTKADILAKDSRFKDFYSFQTGAIYNHYKRVTSKGGNDFWESGVVRPDIVLADLAKIFHPRLVSDHTLYYYHKVE